MGRASLGETWMREVTPKCASHLRGGYQPETETSAMNDVS